MGLATGFEDVRGHGRGGEMGSCKEQKLVHEVSVLSVFLLGEFRGGFLRQTMIERIAFHNE